MPAGNHDTESSKALAVDTQMTLMMRQGQAAWRVKRVEGALSAQVDGVDRLRVDRLYIERSSSAASVAA